METNEIMVTDEVMDLTEEIATAGLGKGVKVAVGIGLVGLGGWMAYKFIIKPIMAKIKAKKNQQEIELDADDYEDITDDEESEETIRSVK